MKEPFVTKSAEARNKKFVFYCIKQQIEPRRIKRVSRFHESRLTLAFSKDTSLKFKSSVASKNTKFLPFENGTN